MAIGSLKTIKVTDSVHERLSKQIQRYGETMSDIIERILDDYENRHKK